MSRVTCHMSRVTFCMSRVTCHVSNVTFFILFFIFFGQSCRGLTRLVNRPGVAGAVLQTASSLSEWVSHPFPPDIHNIMTAKPLELESWNFERMFTPHHVSCVTYHLSRVTCHVSLVTIFFFFFFRQSGQDYWWRVCYQRGLPRLVILVVQKYNTKS